MTDEHQPGLTLVYCIWLSPDDIFDMTTSNGIHDCSIVLFVIAERVQSAKRYRNAFEVIRQKVIDSISQATERRHRETVPGLTEELVAPSSYSLQPNMPFEVTDGSYEEFSRIIRDMTGEDLASAAAAGTSATASTLQANIDLSDNFQGESSSAMGFDYVPNNSGMFRFPATEYNVSFNGTHQN